MSYSICSRLVCSIVLALSFAGLASAELINEPLVEILSPIEGEPLTVDEERGTVRVPIFIKLLPGEHDGVKVEPNHHSLSFQLNDSKKWIDLQPQMNIIEEGGAVRAQRAVLDIPLVERASGGYEAIKIRAKITSFPYDNPDPNNSAKTTTKDQDQITLNQFVSGSSENQPQIMEFAMLPQSKVKGGVFAAQMGGKYAVQAKVYDRDGDDLEYAIEFSHGAPSIKGSSSMVGSLSGQASFAKKDLGSHSATLRVTDSSGLTTQRTIPIKVEGELFPPKIASFQVLPPAKKKGNEYVLIFDRDYQFQAKVSDKDSKSLSFTLSEKGKVFQKGAVPKNGVIQFKKRFPGRYDGTYQLTVSDGDDQQAQANVRFKVALLEPVFESFSLANPPEKGNDTYFVKPNEKYRFNASFKTNGRKDLSYQLVKSGADKGFTKKGKLPDSGKLAFDITFQSSGDHKVELKMFAGKSEFASSAIAAKISQPPVAKMWLNPPMAVAKTPIEMDAFDSSSPLSDIVAYEWDFGDGAQGSGQQVEHEYKSRGEYTVTLNIKDAIGQSASVQQKIKVERSLKNVADTMLSVGEIGKANIDESTQQLVFDLDLRDATNGSAPDLGRLRVLLNDNDILSEDAWVSDVSHPQRGLVGKRFTIPLDAKDSKGRPLLNVGNGDDNELEATVFTEPFFFRSANGDVTKRGSMKYKFELH